MTPFRNVEGKRAIEDLYEFCPNGQGAALNQLVWYLNMEFDIVLESDQHTEEGISYDAVDDGVDIECGFDIWVCAAMLDAVLNGTDYSADCMGFTEMYEHVRKTMQKKLRETKFLSKKPKHDIPALREKAAEALRYITGEICESEVAEAYADRKAEFLSSVDALRARLLAESSDKTALTVSIFF